MKLAVSLIASIVLITSTAIWKKNTTVNQQTPSGLSHQDDPTALSTRLKKEKARGNNEVVFPAPEPMLAEVSSLDEALANYSVVIASRLTSSAFK